MLTQGAGRSRHDRMAIGAIAMMAAAVYSMLAWSRLFESEFLTGAAVLTTAGAALALAGRSLRRKPGARAFRIAFLLLLTALVAGLWASRRFARIEFDWPAVGQERLYERQRQIGRELERLVTRGRRAANLASRVPPAAAGGVFNRLDAIRATTGIDAVVLLGRSGELLAWSGDHRGTLPEEIRSGRTGAFFSERPLFSYLYFTEPAEPPAARAVAAVLVETGLTSVREGAPTPLSMSRTDVLLRSGAGPPGVAWRLTSGTDTVVHARAVPATQASLRQGVEDRARSIIVLAGLAALFSLGAAWLRVVGTARTRVATTIPLLGLAAGLGIAPLGTALGLDPLFAPSIFVLPMPGDVSLGGLLAPAIALAALAATLRPPGLRRSGHRIAVIAGAISVGLAYPATIRLLIEASSPSLLEGGPTLWFGLQAAGLLLLAVVTALALPRERPRPGARPPDRRATLLWGGLAGAVAIGLAIAVLLRLNPAASRAPWTPLAWLAPFILLAIAFNRYGGRAGSLARWLAAGTLAATAVLPHLWVAQTYARLEAASRDVRSLGSELPPIVEFLLVGFAADVQARADAGEDGLQLLYRSWVSSGLAGEPYGARITLWGADNVPLSEVALGGAEGSDTQSDLIRSIVEEARTGGGARVSGFTGAPGISRALTVPLGDGRVVSVSVPPRRSLDRPSILDPFLGSTPDPDIQLTLVEARGGEMPGEEIRWIRQGHELRSDVVVRFPDGLYHAHTVVGTTPFGILLARGALLLTFDAALLALLWFAGSAARGVAPVAPGSLDALTGSFRARVTLALFAFFLVPTTLFGWVAYRAFAREVERAARSVAARAVVQAVQEFPESDGDLRRISERAGSEVLYFFDSGELAQASASEGLGLGVYSAWLSPEVHRALRSGEQTSAEEIRRLGDQSYLIAYHTLRPAGVLAVPTSLSTGDAAARQRELADLILFAAVAGGLLSFGLSVAVGRSLAGPIGRLKRAAAAVGAGRLRVQLPEPRGDEFGELNASFNRMVRRLRRARIRERETARVLAWGEMARQVAHEIKNPLTPIKLSVQHLRRAHRDGRPEFGQILEESSEQILTEIDRLTEIARAFSRYGAPIEAGAALEPVEVHSAVREALTLYRAADESIRYVDDLAPDLPPVIARPGELKEVLLNLVENAREALGGAGTVTVRGEAMDGRVELVVEDDGPGIPPDLIARVFDPHFSTRSTGTGLGLAIVRRLVESWGGSVSAQSEPGRGTTMRLRIPANGQRAR